MTLTSIEIALRQAENCLRSRRVAELLRQSEQFPVQAQGDPRLAHVAYKADRHGKVAFLA